MCCNHGGGNGMLRRTRSSRPWSLPTRHPWRVRVRRNIPLPPPDVVCPPNIKSFCPVRRTDSLSVVTWMGFTSVERRGLDVDSGSKSGLRIQVGGGGSLRRTVPRHSWRAASPHGWIHGVSGAANIRHPQASEVAREVPPRLARSIQPIRSATPPASAKQRWAPLRPRRCLLELRRQLQQRRLVAEAADELAAHRQAIVRPVQRQ